MKSVFKSLCVASLVVAFGGCETADGWFGKDSAGSAAAVPTSKANTQNFSGYLVNYSDMVESHTASGGTRLGWISPNLKKGQYTAIIIDPVGFYPRPPLRTKVSKGQMLAAVQYLVQEAKKEIGRDLKIVEQPGPGVLRWDAAITSTKSPHDAANPSLNQPVAMFFADASPTAVADGNGLLVFLESRLVDTQTQKVVAKSVRAGMGRALADSKARITMTEMKPVLDGWVKDAGVFVRERIK